MPASPSMTTQSSWRISRLASRAPTTAGMSMLRATIAVCEVLPPTSVTKPRKTPPLNCSMSAGEMSPATSTSGIVAASSSRVTACAASGDERLRPPWARTPRQALDHLLEVGLALAQVVVLHLVELARQHLELRRQRPLGVVVALADPVLGRAGQRVVVQQHQVHVEQRRELGRRFGGQGRAASPRARRRRRRGPRAGARSRPRRRRRRRSSARRRGGSRRPGRRGRSRCLARPAARTTGSS